MVSACNNASKQESQTDEHLKAVVYKISGTGPITPRETRVPNDSEKFRLVRNFITWKRAERARIFFPCVLQLLAQNQVVDIKKYSEIASNA